MTNDNQSDLLIVGGGILGTFHAYHALARGLKVILLEKDGQPKGATVRNFGQVVPSGLDKTWQPIGRESLKIYKELQSQFDLSVRNLGTVYIASDEEEQTLLEELYATNKENDYSSQLLNADACIQKFPTLRNDYCRAGLYFPDEVSVDPRRMVIELQKQLSQNPDLQMHFRAKVIDLAEKSSGNVVATSSDHRQFHAEKAIVCSGSEFQSLYPQIYTESDITAVKLQMLRLKSQPEVTINGNVLTGLSIRRYESFSECPSWKEIKSKESQDSFWKKWGVHILFKQETDGSIILGDSHEYAPAGRSDQLGFDLRQDVNQYFIDEGKKIFDLPSWEIDSAWFGVYCQTSDPAGIFRRTIGNNVHIVTGIGGKGMTSSPGFAKQNLGEIYD